MMVESDQQQQQSQSRSVPSVLLCPVCHGALFDPLSLPCGHSLCETCWLKLRTSTPSSSSLSFDNVACPLCRTVANRFHPLRRNFSLADVVAASVCPHVGCDFATLDGPAALARHRETDCEHRTFVCPDCSSQHPGQQQPPGVEGASATDPVVPMPNTRERLEEHQRLHAAFEELERQKERFFSALCAPALSFDANPRTTERSAAEVQRAGMRFGLAADALAGHWPSLAPTASMTTTTAAAFSSPQRRAPQQSAQRQQQQLQRPDETGGGGALADPALLDATRSLRGEIAQLQTVLQEIGPLADALERRQNQQQQQQPHQRPNPFLVRQQAHTHQPPEGLGPVEI